MNSGEDDLQDRIARLLLDALDGTGFALAGAGAIRAHGLTDRPTHDIDLFTEPLVGAGTFRSAIATADQVLQAEGYQVVRLRETDSFARLRVHHGGTGQVLDVDLAVNWRADSPVRLSLGLVLSERDAVAGKLSAVYSRGEIRDFLDLDAIRSSGRYPDEDLLALGREHDDGFDQAMFAAQLSRVMGFDAEEAEEYGVTPQLVSAMQQRVYDWALELRDTPEPPTPPARR